MVTPVDFINDCTPPVAETTFLPDGSGAVYIFVRDVSTGNWTQQVYLKASNAGDNDLFGFRYFFVVINVFKFTLMSYFMSYFRIAHRSMATLVSLELDMNDSIRLGSRTRIAGRDLWTVKRWSPRPDHSRPAGRRPTAKLPPLMRQYNPATFLYEPTGEEAHHTIP